MRLIESLGRTNRYLQFLFISVSSLPMVCLIYSTYEDELLFFIKLTSVFFLFCLKTVVNLTLIDLPGLTKVAVGMFCSGSTHLLFIAWCL